MGKIKILAFYKFTNFDFLSNLKSSLSQVGEANGVLGSILLNVWRLSIKKNLPPLKVKVIHDQHSSARCAHECEKLLEIKERVVTQLKKDFYV